MIAAPALVGTATVEPAGDVVAASVGTWTIRLTVGAYGLDDGGRVLVCRRFASDWGTFQAEDPRAPDYVTAEAASGAAVFRVRWDPRAYVRPWQKAAVVDVVDGSLPPGDVLTITLGDRRGGSPGTRVQTFCEEAFAFRVLVDPFGTGIFAEIPDLPTLRIVAGEPARLVCQVPSWLGLGEGGWAFLRVEDRWGNPAASYRGEVRLTVPSGLHGLPAAVRFSEADGGARRLEGLSAAAPGLYTVAARDRDLDLAAESNPLRVTEAPPRLRPYWGDLHGQSGETVGTGSVEAYFAFARDKANCDFASHQGNDFQVTAAFWERLKAVTRAFHAPGRFVTFLGVEWSGNTPAGGDRNVLYLEDDGPLHRSSRWQCPDDPEEAGDRYPVDALFQSLRGRSVLTIPHIGGRRADLTWHDPALEPVIEVHSAWGTFEWFLEEALGRGYRVGFIAGSDDHKGRPGASHPGAGAFGVQGGLTCAWVPALTREAIWEALRARRVYGTSGERILLTFATADGHLLGEEFATDAPPRLVAEVFGTGPLEAVELWRGLDMIHRPALGPPAPDDSPLIRIAWSGARILQRNRQTVWDGELSLEGGRIVRATGYAFDTPADGITGWDARSVRWVSKTTGDEDGVILEVEAPPEATLHFRSAPVTFTLPLRAITARPHLVPAGGIRQQVVLQRLPLAPWPRQARLEFEDRAWQPGWNAYWLRVRQWDGARAWASPIFVRRKEGAG